MTNRLRLWTTRYQSGRKGEEPGGWVMWAMTCLHTGLNTDKNSEHWRSVSFPEWRDSEYRHTFMLRGWQKPEFGTLLDFPYFTSCCHNKAATVSTALAMCPASPSHYATWGRYARTLLHSQPVEVRVALRTPGFVAGVWSEVFFFFFLSKRGEGKEKERERNINVWLTFVHPLLGTQPTTQACTLTGNRTGDPLVRRQALNHWDSPARAKEKFCERLSPYPVKFGLLWVVLNHTEFNM